MVRNQKSIVLNIPTIGASRFRRYHQNRCCTPDVTHSARYVIILCKLPVVELVLASMYTGRPVLPCGEVVGCVVWVVCKT